ncbi:hypothetical protein COF68_05320 [Bacillus toyonensis]|uniref:hypothetical protein n=1 Tax=Bacillus toyonensis TaxID=155322 RepID=UPI000BFC308C|nr:hypothetical protein [Bacillus toyonensis]PHE64263.1 hypothetical protein COF68_05320 [Bacillus toyonensis]
MIITDKLDYVRENKGCHYSKLAIEGLESQEDNVKMEIENDTIRICKEENPDAPIQYMYVGEKIGIAEGTVVKAQVIFLDGAMHVNILSGFLYIETNMFGVKNEKMLYESNLDANDISLLESDVDVFNTRWITREELFNLLSVSMKAETKEFKEYKTYETMFEVDFSYKSNGLFSCKPSKQFDLSNGKVEELEKEEEAKKELARKQKEEEKLQRKLEAEQRKKQREVEELNSNANKNQDIRDFFNRKLNRA